MRHLVDDEWELIGLFLPIGRNSPYPQRLRQRFERVSWRFSIGGQWQDAPGEFGAEQTVYHRFVHRM
ncbi:transposase [Streptomyces sp. NPDC006739]|uniref:transposase n=1 Tax=Streptomyces sp. NPDC006739 TaxID=3364763 RepID=UPI0036C829DD